MTQIRLEDVKDPLHRKFLKEYGYSMTNTPLKTKFHSLPTHDTIETALNPKYDLTKYVFPELLYRFYFDSNFTCLVFGSRADFKSTFATWIALECMRIGGIKEPVAFDFVVDSDSDLVAWYQKEDLPPFTTLIKDEWDAKISGLGVATMSETLANVIKRVRGRRINLVICTPEFRAYPVDFFFKTWEYQRYGAKKIKLLVYSEEQDLKGYIVVPMPTDAQIDKYSVRKKEFLKRTQTLAFTLDERLVEIAEHVIKDQYFPALSLDKQGNPVNKCKGARLTYIGLKFQAEMQSEALKKRVEEIATFLQKNKLDKFPYDKPSER